MSTPFIDLSALTNTIVGLLGPLISLVITIQIFKLVIQLVSGLATEVRF
jgi:hypothetical protein